MQRAVARDIRTVDLQKYLVQERRIAMRDGDNTDLSYLISSYAGNVIHPVTDRQERCANRTQDRNLGGFNEDYIDKIAATRT